MVESSSFVIAFLTLAAFATSAVSAVVGMVGSTLLVGITSLVLPLTAAIPVHGVSSLASNLSRCLWLWPRVPKGILTYFALGVPLGAGGAYFVLATIEERTWFLLLLIGVIVFTLSKPKELVGIRIPLWGFTILGAVSTWLACLVGSVGPLIVPFVVRDDIDKEQFVALKAAFQILLHLVKLPIFYLLAFPYIDYLPLLALMALASVVGSRLGLTLLRQLDQAQFVRCVRAVLVLIALSLSYTIVADFYPVASAAMTGVTRLVTAPAPSGEDD